MLNSFARVPVSKLSDPIGRFLLRTGLTPNIVTIIGTFGVVGGSVGLLATDQLFWGTVVVTVFVLFDLLDGAMARARGYGTPFGVVLDASCDRIADGALFGSIALWAFVYGESVHLGIAALIAVVGGHTVSYIKARADSVNLHISGGLAERAERNIIGLVGTGLAGLGVPLVLPILLWVLAVASALTVIQRLVQVHRAAVRQEAPHDDVA